MISTGVLDPLETNARGTCPTLALACLRLELVPRPPRGSYFTATISGLLLSNLN